jgi:peptidoglycan hydrolase-like protein with peptidoglycan-binding domain
VRTRPGSFLAASLLIGASFGAATAVLPAAAGTAAADAPATTAYHSLDAPLRLLDTRDAAAPVPQGGVVNVRVAGAPGLPDVDVARVAVLNVTVVGPAGEGFWTVFPHGTDMPLASNVNVDERSSLLGGALAIPNLVTVPIGDDGTVDVFSQRGGHLVVDMLGAYWRSDATSAGRFLPLAKPDRVLDTRDGMALQAGSTTTVHVDDADGASAAVVNLTTIATAAGYWTVFPTGTTPPLAANLNSLYPLHIVANQAIAPLDANGDFDVFTQSGGHLVVDLVGLISGDSAPVSSDGLFVPLPSPTRFLDTRDPSLNPLGGSQMLLPAWNLAVPVASNPAIQTDHVAALSMNLTMTDALAGGYVSLSPAGSYAPDDKHRDESTLNIVRAVQTLPNHATVAVSNHGFDVFSQSGGHVIADVSGYYLGDAVPSPFGPPSNQSTTPAGCPGYPNTPVGAIVPGASPATVRRAQQRLIDLGFWLSAVDGGYGWTTSQAVMAFQKWSKLANTNGTLDEATAVALNGNLCRPTPGITSGDLIEVDKGKQLLFIVRGGKALWVLNTSTGGNYDYTAKDQKTGATISDKAYTPVGTFRVYRVSDDPAYFGSLGELYRPRFFVGGVAVHGYRSVPNYPASHGCVRISNPAMDMIWASNAMPMGSTVVVHD